jgi:hypothetical protein
MSATQPAATGPPSTIAAITGAIETLTNVPRGIRTGNAPANSVMTVQKMTPIRRLAGSLLGSGRAMSSVTRKSGLPLAATRLVSTSATALKLTSHVM